MIKNLYLEYQGERKKLSDKFLICTLMLKFDMDKYVNI